MPLESSFRRSRVASTSSGRRAGATPSTAARVAGGLLPPRPRLLLLLALGEVGIEAARHDPVHQAKAVEGVAGVGDPARAIGPDAVLLDVLRGSARRRRASPERRGPGGVISSRFSRMTTVDLTSRPDMPIASARCSAAAARMSVERLLDAEVDHPVAVVGQDDVDQVLADVVDVALDRGEHDRALLRCPRPAPCAARDTRPPPSSSRRAAARRAAASCRLPNRSPTTFMPSSRMVVDDVERRVLWPAPRRDRPRGPDGRRR